MGIRTPLCSSFPLPSIQIHPFLSLAKWILSNKSLRVSVALSLDMGWLGSAGRRGAWHWWVTEEPFLLKAEGGFVSLFSIFTFSSFYPNPPGSVYCHLEHLLNFFFYINQPLSYSKPLQTKPHCHTDSENSLLLGSNKEEVTESWVHGTGTPIYTHNCVITSIVEMIGIKT